MPRGRGGGNITSGCISASSAPSSVALVHPPADDDRGNSRSVTANLPAPYSRSCCGQVWVGDGDHTKGHHMPAARPNAIVVGIVLGRLLVRSHMRCIGNAPAIRPLSRTPTPLGRRTPDTTHMTSREERCSGHRRTRTRSGAHRESMTLQPFRTPAASRTMHPLTSPPARRIRVPYVRTLLRVYASLPDCSPDSGRWNVPNC
jgi:hypothetical protein